MITAILLFTALFGFAVWKEADVIIAGTYSLMLGFLYDKAEYEDENVTDHTFQIALLCVIITFKWES
jgi:hypothetical protein